MPADYGHIRYAAGHDLMRNIDCPFRVGLSVLILLAMCSCASSQLVAKNSEMVRARHAENRLLVRTGDVTISVDDPKQALPIVRKLVSDAGGFVERSTADQTATWMTCRVPADSLDSMMDDIENLGESVRRSVSASDVTDQHSDLSARLETSLQLRLRMRALLDRATDVEDLLAIEKELARVQSEIEGMQARLERLNSQIQLSSLSVRLEQRQILGPLGFVGYWTGWALSKLFVIR
jgi:hypothetical protein